jgi:putative DNA primase/helicase
MAILEIPPRPVALAMCFERIPDVLKSRRQWVVWSYWWNGDKWDKPPRGAGIRAASSTDPSTWLTFGEAVHLYQTYGLDGIGFVVSKDDPFTIIDVDGCIEPCGHFHSRAFKILERFPGTYAERSPSSTGIRIIVVGELPIEGSGLNKQGAGHTGAEVYHRDKFFTITGHVIPGREGAPVADRQKELTAWLAEEWKDEIDRRRVHRSLFGNSLPSEPTSAEIEVVLFNLTAEYPHLATLISAGWPWSRQSVIDWHFCKRAAEFCGFDRWLLDAVFRATALMRPKWDRRLKATTYGWWTIDGAIAEEMQWAAPVEDITLAGEIDEPELVEDEDEDEPGDCDPPLVEDDAFELEAST